MQFDYYENAFEKSFPIDFDPLEKIHYFEISINLKITN